MILTETVAHLHKTMLWDFRVLMGVNIVLYMVLIWLIVGINKDKDK